MKKFLIVLMAVAMASFLFVGCFPGVTPDPDVDEDVAVTGVTLDKATLAFTVGDAAVTLVVTVAPADATDTSVIWASSDRTVAIVAAGVVTPLNAGISAITVTTVDGDFAATCVVTVTAEVEPEPEPEPELVLVGIEVDPKTMELFVGEDDNITSVTATYEIRGYEVDLDLTKCTFLSSDLDVATVSDDGLVTAIEVGTADILVSYEGKFDTLEVTVTAIPDPKPMEIIADLPLFEIDEQTKFTISFVANDDVGKNVLAYFTVPSEAELYYWEVEGEYWGKLTGDVIFGPHSPPVWGFPLEDATTKFKATFNKVGTYTTVVEVWTVDPGDPADPPTKIEPLCFEIISAVVGPPEL